MLNLLEYVLHNLRLNKNILIPEDNYTPNILKSNLLVLDKAAQHRYYLFLAAIIFALARWT